MILKNNKIIIVLNVIMLLIVTGLSTYAYHKQKSYSNQITLITNSSTNFKNENDLNKKFEIFKKLINDKNEILDSKDDEISSKYNDTISQMKEELKSSIKNTIKENTLDSQALSDAQKVESSKNKLEELKSFVTKNAIDIYENEEQSKEIILEIDTALNNNVVSQPVIQQSQNYNYTQEVQPQTYQSNQQQATTRSQSTTTRRTTRSR